MSSPVERVPPPPHAARLTTTARPTQQRRRSFTTARCSHRPDLDVKPASVGGKQLVRSALEPADDRSLWQAGVAPQLEVGLEAAQNGEEREGFTLGHARP